MTQPIMTSYPKSLLPSDIGAQWRAGTALGAGERDEFWSQQKELMEEMTGRAERSLKDEQREKFARRRTALVADTAIFTSLILSMMWVLSANPYVSLSYALGATFGLAYSYGLGKYVETLGGSIDDAGEIQGAGIGQARFAFLILLFLFVGKFRSQGLIEIPSIAGFFTYQVRLSSLLLANLSCYMLTHL